MIILSGGLIQIIMLVAVFGIFYLILILPEKKRRKTYGNMIDKLKINDRIMTRSGLIGKITEIDDNTIIIEAEPDKVRLTFSKQGISTLLTEETNM